jgi:DNA-binding response OmpR family regulator
MYSLSLCSILIAESDPRLRRVVYRALCGSGYTVMEASTLAEMRHLLACHNFDVALCDLNLNKEQASHITDEYREKLALMGTKTIYVTKAGVNQALYAASSNEYFLKQPVAIHTILMLINRFATKAIRAAV